MAGYPTVVDRELGLLAPDPPAITFDGAMAVGKTDRSTARATTYLLDDAVVRAVVEADPARALGSPRPVLLDE